MNVAMEGTVLLLPILGASDAPNYTTQLFLMEIIPLSHLYSEPKIQQVSYESERINNIT